MFLFLYLLASQSCLLLWKRVLGQPLLQSSKSYWVSVFLFLPLSLQLRGWWQLPALLVSVCLIISCLVLYIFSVSFLLISIFIGTFGVKSIFCWHSDSYNIYSLACLSRYSSKMSLETEDLCIIQDRPAQAVVRKNNKVLKPLNISSLKHRGLSFAYVKCSFWRTISRPGGEVG